MFGYGVGATKSGVQAAIHVPCARLQPGTAATPKTRPAKP